MGGIQFKEIGVIYQETKTYTGVLHGGAPQFCPLVYFHLVQLYYIILVKQ